MATWYPRRARIAGERIAGERIAGERIAGERIDGGAPCLRARAGRSPIA